MDEIEKDKAADEQVRTRLQEIVGSIMHTHKQSFLQVGMAPVLSMLQTLLASKHEGDLLLGLYVADDFLERLQEESVPHWGTFLPALLDSVASKDEDVRQAAAYGLRHAAKLAAFAPHATAAATRLVNAVNDPKAKKKKYKAATDNVVCALGFLSKSHAAAAAHFPLFLQQLPLKDDEEAGLEAHKLLLTCIQGNILGAGQQHAPQAFVAMAEVYKGSASDDDLNKAIVALCKQFGKTNLEQLHGQLDTKQKKKLQRLTREAGIA